MWQKRPRGQLDKCAEAAALRGAFPEEIGDEFTSDEGALIYQHGHVPNFKEAQDAADQTILDEAGTQLLNEEPDPDFQAKKEEQLKALEESKKKSKKKTKKTEDIQVPFM